MHRVITDEQLQGLAGRLIQVRGVRAILLGGSRGHGDHSPDSDHDLGLYYEPPLDVAALQELARSVAGPGAQVTVPGAWGSWVDGGAWLEIGVLRSTGSTATSGGYDGRGRTPGSAG